MASSSEPRSWAELPPDVTSSILLRLSVAEILENAKRVCTSWRRVCKDPLMWRKIRMKNPNLKYQNMEYEAMCRHAVDLSKGGLLEIHLEGFGSDSLVAYIAERSSNLRGLGFKECGDITSDGIFQALAKFPLLEELELSYFAVEKQQLRAIGKYCPNLKTLKLNWVDIKGGEYDANDVALAIAQTLPGLGHLQLIGDSLTDAGLNAILDNCPDLEHLDLNQCYNIKIAGDLETRCSQRIKVLILPNPLNPFASGDDDYPFPVMTERAMENFDYRELDTFIAAITVNDQNEYIDEFPDDYDYFDYLK